MASLVFAIPQHFKKLEKTMKQGLLILFTLLMTVTLSAIDNTAGNCLEFDGIWRVWRVYWYTWLRII